MNSFQNQEHQFEEQMVRIFDRVEKLRSKEESIQQLENRKEVVIVILIYRVLYRQENLQ